MEVGLFKEACGYLFNRGAGCYFLGREDVSVLQINDLFNHSEAMMTSL